MSIKIPRFYVNTLEWLASSGVSTGLDNIYRTLPISPVSWASTWQPDNIGISLSDGFLPQNRFIAILGHTMNSDSSYFNLRDLDNTSTEIEASESIVNFGGTATAPEYNGFTIAKVQDDIDDMGSVYLFVSANTTIGSIIIGTYYDMINAPNLSLSYDIEFGGVDEITSQNGSSLSNLNWAKSSNWGDRPPWELDKPSATFYVNDPNYKNLSRSGRKIFKLNFSFIADSDLWGSNQSLSNIINTNANLDTGDEIAANWAEVPLSNGDFSSSLDGTWFTGNQYPATINGSNQCVLSNGGTNGNVFIYKQDQLINNREYKLVYDLIDVTAGELVVETSLANSLGTTTGTNLEVYFNSVGSPNSGTMFSIKRKLPAASTNVTIDNLRLYISTSAVFQYNLLTDDNFFSQVWHKTLGGTLPFVFQPDNTKSDPDSFIIARFKNNSLKATQTSINTYDISLIIEEVW